MVKRTSRYTAPTDTPGLSGILARLALSGFTILCLIGFLKLVPAKAADTPAYRKVMRASIPELAYARGSLYSHVLLPDGRCSIRAFDEAAHTADAARIAALFPRESDRTAVLQWGRALFESARINYRLSHQIATKASANVILSPHATAPVARQRLERLMAIDPGPELCAHAAWRRLTAMPWMTEAALAQLPSAVTKAIPDEAERRAVLDWAEMRRTRRALERRFTVNGQPLTHHVRPLPPNLPWMRSWIVWEEWCPTPETHAARKKHLLDCFGATGDRAKERAFIRLGEKLLAARASDPAAQLPGTGERAAMMAVVDRFSGLDPTYSPRAAEAAATHLAPRPFDLLDVVPEVFARVTPGFILNYDDWAAVHDSGLQESVHPGSLYRIEDAFHDGPPDPYPSSEPDDVFAPAAIWALALVVVWMCYGLTVFLAADLPGVFLGLRSDPEYGKLMADLDGKAWLNIGVLAVIGFVTEMIASQFLDPLRTLLQPGGGGPSAGPFLQYVLAGLFGLGFDTLIRVIAIRLGSTPPPALAFLSFALGFVLSWAVGAPVATSAIGAAVGVAVSFLGNRVPVQLPGLPGWTWWFWVPPGIIGLIIGLNIAFAPSAEESRAAAEFVSGGKWEVKAAPDQPQWWQTAP